MQTVTEARARRLYAGVEQRARISHEAPLVMGSFPADAGQWGAPAERFGRLRDRAAFCGALGPALTPSLEGGWQVATLRWDEEMADEWVLAVVAPHHTEVVVADDAGERDPDGRRLLDLVASRDREVVARVAGMLMRKLARPTVGVDGRLLAASS